MNISFFQAMSHLQGVLSQSLAGLTAQESAAALQDLNRHPSLRTLCSLESLSSPEQLVGLLFHQDRYHRRSDDCRLEGLEGETDHALRPATGSSLDHEPYDFVGFHTPRGRSLRRDPGIPREDRMVRSPIPDQNHRLGRRLSDTKKTAAFLQQNLPGIEFARLGAFESRYDGLIPGTDHGWQALLAMKNLALIFHSPVFPRRQSSGLAPFFLDARKTALKIVSGLLAENE